MTRKEWMKEHYPETINDKCAGGVLGCPRDYWMLGLTDASISGECPHPNYNPDKENLHDICSICWNHEIEEEAK